MYVISSDKKRDPVARWNLPDRVFFAAGACHILAFAFLERFGNSGYRPLWIKPAPGFAGNHIIVARGDEAFDYHGYCHFSSLMQHMKRKAGRWWPGWRCEVRDLPTDVLICESKSRRYSGLWLREPKQYLHDALPRARAFLNRFPAPARALQPEVNDHAF